MSQYSQPSNVRDHSPKTILIIDDNVDVADSLKLWLSLSGHRVLTAYSGLDGIETAKFCDPHYVLIDIGLPDINGYQIAEDLRKYFDTKPVKLIALSGYSRREGGSPIFDQHIDKPMTSEKLSSIGLW